MAQDKASPVCPSVALGRAIQGEARGSFFFPGPISDSSVNLGIDDAAGNCLRIQGRSNKLKIRVKLFQKRATRVANLRSVLGHRRTPGVFTAGPLPGVLYGSEVRGVTDYELLYLRRAAARTIKPSVGGRPVALLPHLIGDPARIGAIAPILRWRKEVFLTQ
eukprot:242636-Pyramimonas_sp.AAC.1